MKEVADQKLKKTYSRKVGQEIRNKEPLWVTKEVREEIKERKRLNRIKRNTNDEREKEKHWEEYKIQKEKVKDIVRRGMFKYENKKKSEIRDKKNGNKKLWENINELRGKENEKGKELKIYSGEGLELRVIEKEREIREF